MKLPAHGGLSSLPGNSSPKSELERGLGQPCSLAMPRTELPPFQAQAFLPGLVVAPRAYQIPAPTGAAAMAVVPVASHAMLVALGSLLVKQRSFQPWLTAG